MASKKDNLPLTVDTDTEQTSSITYASEVVAIIAGVAAGEVEGIAGMCNISGGILGKNRNITKGVKVEVGTEEASVDLYVIIEYGTPIQKAAQDAQENVRKSIESMTGLHVEKVDLHVVGVSFEKENQEMQQSQQLALTIEEEHPVSEEPQAEVIFEEETAEAETPSEEEAPLEDDAEEEETQESGE